MNEIKVYVNGDHTIHHYSGGYMATNGNGNAGVKVIAPFLVTHTLYALYRKPNGLKANRYLMVATGDTETVEVSAGVFEEWNIWTDVIDSAVINIDSAVTQSVGLVIEDWYFKPEDGFLGIVQYSADIPAYLTAQGLTPVEGDFIRVVDTNTDWEYLSTVWTDSSTKIVGTESRVPVQLVNLPADASFATGLPTIVADNTEVIIDILNGKMSITTAVATFVKQALTEYNSGGSVEDTDLIYIDRGGVPKYVTAAQLAAGGGGIVNGSDSWLNSLGFIDTGDISRISWNATDNTLEYNVDANVKVKIGADIERVLNNIGSTMTKGLVGYLSGSSGTRTTVGIASNDDKVKAHATIGLISYEIINNQEGFIRTKGLMENIDTTHLVEGSPVFLGLNGLTTSTQPEAPLFKVELGICVRNHATLGSILVNVEKVHQIGEAPDVHAPNPVDKDLLLYNLLAARYENVNIDTVSFPKTGWDLNVQTLVALEVFDATRTFKLLKISAVVPYWQENVKYELDADMEVIFDDVEGKWFIYIVDGVLTASQTAWDLRADNTVSVSVVNWDATNKVATAVAFECHSWKMSGVDHADSHFGLKTLYISGLGLSDNGGDGLALTNGVIADEDIWNRITHSATPTAMHEQVLTPAMLSYKYGRIGANGDLRRYDSSLIPFYVVGNKVQLNPFSGGVWGLVDMTPNSFGAYWVIITSDITNPAKIFMGQNESSNLNDAKEDNTITDLDLGTIPFEEVLTAYRIIVKQISSAPYYEIIEINNMIVNPITGETVDLTNSHGALLGLEQDDHTQYFNQARLDAYKISAIDPDIALRVEKNLSNDTNYPVAALVDTDRMFVDVAGTPKKTTLADIATFANTATGAFVSTADYKADGLGAYKSAMLTYFTLILDTLGKFKTTIKTQVTDQILYVTLPVIASNTNNLQISTDNGVTYYDVLLNGNNIQADKLSEQLVELQFDGSNFIILNNVDIENVEVFYGGKDGAYKTDIDNVDHAIDGEVTTNIETAKGLTVNQPNIDGDLASGLVGDFVDVGANLTVVDNKLIATGDGTSALILPYKPINMSVKNGDLIFVKMIASIPTGATSAIIQFMDGASTIESIAMDEVFDTFVVYHGIKTVTQDYADFGLGIRATFPDAGTANGKIVSIDYMMVDNITNNAQLNTLTAEQISSRIPLYIEGINSIENLNIDSTGKNKFDKTTVAIGIKQDTNGNTSSSATTSTSAFIRALPSKDYFFTGNDANGRFITYWDSEQNFISSLSYINDEQFTTPSNCAYVKISFATTELDVAQLELGTVATTHEDYITSNLVVRGTMRSVGDVYDTPTLKSVDEYTLASAEVTTLFTSLVNYDIVGTADLGIAIAELLVTQEKLGDFTYSPADTDLITKIGTWRVNATSGVAFRIPKGTYADLAAAQADLDGTKIVFPLATPIPQELDIDGAILSSVDATFVQSSDNGLNNIFSVIQAENFRGRVDIMNDTLLTHSKEIKEVAGDLDTTNEAVAINAGNVNTNTTNIGTNNTNIGNNAGAISDNEDDILINIDDIANLQGVVLYSTSLACELVESSPTIRTLTTGDFDTYSTYQITIALTGNKIRKVRIELVANGDISHFKLTGSVSFAGGTIEESAAKLERLSSNTFAWYNGTKITNGVPTATTNGFFIKEIRGIK